ncbi:MAG: RluA family pseudouridine synthase [Actinomycetota bacterium]
MSDRRRIEVPDAADGERVDRLLALELDLSRSAVARLVADGEVTIDDEPVTTRSRRLAGGEVVEVVVPEPDDPRPAPDPSIVPVVVHEDDDLLVVDKPVGLVVHPGAGNRDGTLVNGLVAHYPELVDVGDPTRPGMVHRLDRDTTGLLVVARTQHAYDELVAALSARAVGRTYHVLVHGRPEAPRGRIDARIGRSPKDPTRMAVLADGREAITDYEVLEALDGAEAARLECHLHTGRTHQIRVHLKAIGLPVLGDDRYGRLRHGATRPMLHAHRLRFTHPSTDDELELESPPPDDYAAVLAQLRAVEAASG